MDGLLLHCLNLQRVQFLVKYLEEEEEEKKKTKKTKKEKNKKKG